MRNSFQNRNFYSEFIYIGLTTWISCGGYRWHFYECALTVEDKHREAEKK